MPLAQRQRHSSHMHDRSCTYFYASRAPNRGASKVACASCVFLTLVCVGRAGPALAASLPRRPALERRVFLGGPAHPPCSFAIVWSEHTLKFMVSKHVLWLGPISSVPCNVLWKSILVEN